MQLSGGTFPTGGFNHSYGLETYLQTEQVKTIEDVENILRVQLTILKNSDAIFLKEAFNAIKRNDAKDLIELQDYYTALKMEAEIVQASLKTGRSLLNGVLSLYKGDIQERLLEINRLRVSHYSIVYGAIGAVLDLRFEEAIFTLYYSTLSNIVHVATRIMPLGQTQAQMLIRSICHEISIDTVDYQKLTLKDVSVFSPGIQLASMEHETLFSRLCMS